MLAHSILVYNKIAITLLRKLIKEELKYFNRYTIFDVNVFKTVDQSHGLMATDY